MSANFTAVGKQVLQGAMHFADAANNEAAVMIVEAMNAYGLPIDQPEPFRSIGPHHAIRQESDEYACSCGMRWGTDEGEEHP